MLNLSIFHFSFDIWHLSLPASRISQIPANSRWFPAMANAKYQMKNGKWPRCLFPLNYLHDLIGFYFGQFFNSSAGPSNRDVVDRRRRAEAEMQPPIGMRDIAVARADFVDLCQASGLEFDARADGVAVRFRPLQLQTYPMAGLRSAVVAEQRGRAVYFIDDHVDVPVFVVVTERGPARRAPLCQGRN